jgi:hypothetical protein
LRYIYLQAKNLRVEKFMLRVIDRIQLMLYPTGSIVCQLAIASIFLISAGKFKLTLEAQNNLELIESAERADYQADHLIEPFVESEDIDLHWPSKRDFIYQAPTKYSLYLLIASHFFDPLEVLKATKSFRWFHANAP